MFDAEHNPADTPSRAVRVSLAAVITFALIGYFVGVRHEHTPTYEPAPRDADASAVAAIPAMAYGEFDRRLFGPNRDWRNVIDDVEKRASHPSSSGGWQEPGRLEIRLAARAQRRAFDGAPPTVPHPIEQMSSTECLICHTQARYVGNEVYAPAMSHELLPNCTQCHIEQQSSLGRAREVANTFEGTIRPRRGLRVPGFRGWDAAPPVVPHSLVMRENCMSCHGPAGAHAIRVDHPWDAVCLQCHAPSIAADRMANFARPDTLRRLGMIPQFKGAPAEADQ